MQKFVLLCLLICCGFLQSTVAFHTVALHSVAQGAELDTAALKAADDARVAATIAVDKSQLEKILSNDLIYAHSNALVDTKSSLIETLVAGKTKYLELEYEKRDFREASPDVALMTGRVRIRARTAAGEMNATLSFLAVWRLEEGEWRFLAWQSCRVPADAPATTK